MRTALACFLLLIAVPPIPGQAPGQPANKRTNPKDSARTEQQPAQQIRVNSPNPDTAKSSHEGGAEQKQSNDPVSISTVKPLDIRADIQKDWMDRLNWVLTAALVLIGALGIAFALRTIWAIENQGK